MRVLHLCKMDTGGGAADGFRRIHRALLDHGVESVAYVMKARSGAPGILSSSELLNPLGRLGWAARRLAAKAARFGRSIEGVFDLDAEGCFPAAAILDHAKGIHPRWDLVILHWPGGYLSPESVVAIADGLGARLALWQVDMSHMTGGCHYSLDCDRFTLGCGACPNLSSSDSEDISHRQALRRRDIWARARAIVLCQSRWSADKAERSWVLGGLTRAVVPIPLEGDPAPAPIDAAEARRRLGISVDSRRVVLVRAVAPSVRYKGFADFAAALRLLDAGGQRLHVLTVGDRGRVPTGLRHITHTDLGHLSGPDKMAEAYRATDVFVCTSLDDAGPMMVPEALVAGRPVLSTPVGIALDVVRDGVNGRLLSAAGAPAVMAEGLRYYCEMSPERLAAQQAAASTCASLFAKERLASALAELSLP